jgi:hypothetical protein
VSSDVATEATARAAADTLLTELQVHAGVDHIDISGNSYCFVSPPGTMWTDNWTEVAANMLGVRTRRNIAYSGSSACHSDTAAGSHGGWSWVLQNMLVPGMPSCNISRGYPYQPVAKLVFMNDVLNDLAMLGSANPTPYLHAHRTILAARSLAAIYLASGSDSPYGSAIDAALAFKNSAGTSGGSWARTAGGGLYTVSQTTRDTHANAGTGYLATTAVGDKLTFTTPTDAPTTGRVYDICIPVLPADNYTVTVTVGGTSYTPVVIQGSAICDPAATMSSILNGYTLRLGSGGPTDPTNGAVIGASNAIVVQLNSVTAGSLKISHTGMESDPLDGPLFLPMTCNRIPAYVGYSLWDVANGFAHGPDASTNPLNDASELSFITSQQTMEAAEFPQRVIPFNGDTALGDNVNCWSDGHTSNINPHPNLFGQRTIARAAARAVINSPLLTDRIRTQAKIPSRSYVLPVGYVSETTLANGWTNSNFASLFLNQPPGFTIDMDGRVTIQGILSATAATAATMWTMPQDMCPAGEDVIYIPADITNGSTKIVGFVCVLASGAVQLDAPTSGVIGISGVTVAFHGTYDVQR